VILEGIKGKGHYVGTFLAWTQLTNGWWGEGEIKFFIDDDREYPTICGTGTEDYFCGAWGFGGETYSTPFLGYPLFRKEPGEVPKHGLYRWHVLDPIRFEKKLKVTIQALGWWLNGKIFCRKTLGRFQLKIFNVLVPVLRIVDPLLPWTGLSLVVVARKK